MVLTSLWGQKTSLCMHSPDIFVWPWTLLHLGVFACTWGGLEKRNHPFGYPKQKIGKWIEDRLTFHIILTYTCNPEPWLLRWFMDPPLSPWAIYPAAYSIHSSFYQEHSPHSKLDYLLLFTQVLLNFFFFGHDKDQLSGPYFLDQGLNPGSQQWKHRVLTPGPPGNSQVLLNLNVYFSKKLSFMFQSNLGHLPP